MKNLIKVAMMMLFALTVKAQHMHHMGSDAKEQKTDMVKMMGTPTFEQTVDRIKVQVWLITQEEHRKILSEHQKEMKHDMKDMKHSDMKMDHDMKGMDHGDMKMDHDMKDMDHGDMKMPARPSGGDSAEKHDDHAKMMEGTHHVMVTLMDERSGNLIEDAKIFLEVTAPSKQSYSVELTGMMSHFGGGVALDEKGKYTLIVGFKNGKDIKKAQFIYGNK